MMLSLSQSGPSHRVLCPLPPGPPTCRERARWEKETWGRTHEEVADHVLNSAVPSKQKQVKNERPKIGTTILHTQQGAGMARTITGEVPCKAQRKRSHKPNAFPFSAHELRQVPCETIWSFELMDSAQNFHAQPAD